MYYKIFLLVVIEELNFPLIHSSCCVTVLTIFVVHFFIYLDTYLGDGTKT